MSGFHESKKALSDEWLTPRHILRALGPFDLDPCAPVKRPWPMAKRHYTINDNGLKQPWRGYVWCNPPYGDKAGRWVARLAHHGDGIALVFARTDTGWFFDGVWKQASAMLFLKGRVNFSHPNGSAAFNTAGAPSVLIAYGARATEKLKDSKLVGQLIINKPTGRKQRWASLTQKRI